MAAPVSEREKGEDSAARLAADATRAPLCSFLLPSFGFGRRVGRASDGKM
eukprot:CAMPEP_0175993872 /NCGR_PEP_ID=MMETSP0108-20121206/54229_1 /TAXON_ID=195067 ORGANISM="Goniomonas pacifica, Strain CCMP1869" /NCGR_SAMPLE_ID=MMETSP0108 /ASSEMBLY_ACC=CAM_ASM_000204 /LENGTH=49 /DNA_ID= /DNA_START= /DNA_END= /DNA_ORIENTATION=